MAVIINGTSGITNVNGSASTPAETGTDTDTGIYYGTNTVGLATNGTNALFIDASQNVGIGTTSPSTLGLQVTKGAGVQSGIAITNPASSWAIRCGASTNYLDFTDQAAGERMRIDSSGNVGIGTTTTTINDQSGAARPFVVASSDSGTTVGGFIPSLNVVNTNTTTNNGAQLNFASTYTSGGINTSSAYVGAIFGARTNTNNYYAAGTLVFGTSAGGASIGPAERMRIDSSGNLLVGTTTTGGGLFKVQAATDVCLAVASATGVTGAITLNAINNANSANIPFDIRASAIYASAGIGTTASAANAYFNNAASNQFLRSTSALKYKTNIRDLESIDVNKFRPVRYNSLCEADDKTKEHFGIIADEVDAAGIKELVTYGEDNQIEGFQYERLTVVLLKVVQEQQALITQLQADVATLKGQA